MKYVMEGDMAFDRTGLGFPSVKGCLALVYQTAQGLYGAHWTQCSAEKQGQKADVFRDFVRNHAGAMPAGTRLYGVTFVGERYANNQHTEWRTELGIFASRLNLTGKASGYDLTKSYPGGNRSAYVQYDPAGAKCNVSIREWADGEMATGRVTNPTPWDHKSTNGGGWLHLASEIELDNVVSGIGAGALTPISKERLRLP